MDSPLLKLERYFERNRDERLIWAIPDIFSQPPEAKITHTPTGEMLTNPYDYFYQLVRSLRKDSVPGLSLSKIQNNQSDGEWLRQSIIYSSLVRTSAAFDADRSGYIEHTNVHGHKETGTFIKMIALLPHLRRMGIDALYLLPIMKHSRRQSKGDPGSPYSVIDFFALDPSLKETLTGEAFTIEEEFAALVDAAHALGIRVLIDFIPRTNGLDSTFIRDYPEWFYWIDCDARDDYRPPRVEGIPSTTPPTEEQLPTMYGSDDVKRHIQQFRADPRTLDADTFAAIKDEADILGAIEETFNLTVAPAFSDQINDQQPAWDDVTFFKLYLDHPSSARPYVEDDTPPFILHDTIKSNLYPGRQPNTPLWETLKGVLPYYQRTFGIDGARIDMGHALPEELLHGIIESTREVDPDFGLITEELDPSNAEENRAHGFNIMAGNGFYLQPRVEDGQSKAFFRSAPHLSLPPFAAAETHDTPRLAAREGGEKRSIALSALNALTPGSVPFINAGLETFEKQAMNLGLDATDIERRRLPYNHPYYGRLALFDYFPLDYLHQRRHLLPALLRTLFSIRNDYRDAYASGSWHFLESDNPAFIGYCLQGKTRGLLILANLSTTNDASEEFDLPAGRPDSLMDPESIVNRRFSTHQRPARLADWDFSRPAVQLAPCEVQVVEILPKP